jgi:hypothetical protein
MDEVKVCDNAERRGVKKIGWEERNKQEKKIVRGDPKATLN